MRNKVGAAFTTGASGSNGKEITMLTILGAMLGSETIVISAGGPFGRFGASATTGSESPGIDAKEITEARELGKRAAEVAALVKRASGK
jgi:NAD(P)H dehydrogenase (quinone)